MEFLPRDSEFVGSTNPVHFGIPKIEPHGHSQNAKLEYDGDFHTDSHFLDDGELQ